MTISKLDIAEKVPYSLDGRKMYSTPGAEIIHLTLKPGEVVEKHKNPFDVAVYVLEGRGILETDEDSVTVGPDMCAGIEADRNRGIRNTGTGVMRVLVVKVF